MLAVKIVTPALYQRLYGTPITDTTYQLVCDAFGRGKIELSDKDNAVLMLIHHREVDPLALEYALRQQDPCNVLTKLFRLISYLVEMSGEKQQCYIKPTGFIRCIFALSPLLFRSVFLRLKGIFILRGKHRA